MVSQLKAHYGLTGSVDTTGGHERRSLVPENGMRRSVVVNLTCALPEGVSVIGAGRGLSVTRRLDSVHDRNSALGRGIKRLCGESHPRALCWQADSSGEGREGSMAGWSSERFRRQAVREQSAAGGSASHRSHRDCRDKAAARIRDADWVHEPQSTPACDLPLTLRYNERLGHPPPALAS